MKLIFIHGSGGCKEAWQYQTEAFENSEAVNLPGHPDGASSSRIEDYVEWLRGRIQEAGDTDWVLVGHSMGGGIALLYALTYPGDLKAVVTIGSGARLRVHPQFLEDLEKAVKDPSQYEATLQEHDQIEPELRAVLRRRSLENGPQAALNDMRACDGFDIMDRIGEITLPVLAICGSEDIMTPPKYSHFLAEKLPNARAEIIPGGTHMVFAEQPEAVNNAIRQFLSGL
jgi:pimeloyl-ACP methyl ester carboxylesterase